jgi:hypothetical protein
MSAPTGREFVPAFVAMIARTMPCTTKLELVLYDRRREIEDENAVTNVK